MVLFQFLWHAHAEESEKKIRKEDGQIDAALVW